MANKMLIDAAHPEETRVVVLRGNRVEEFDFESASRKQLRGNIYLAKVTRVEPSLQAAFVDYGGNRHGFLAFSEIHPDYYQIPIADRQALLEAEEMEDAEAEARAAEADARAEERRGETPAGESGADSDVDTESGTDDGAAEAIAESSGLGGSSVSEEPADDADEGESEGAAETGTNGHSARRANGHSLEVVSDDHVESVGAEDALEELPERKKARVRQYKIQEVIKRRQVLLVQVVKEERGNKGAALTTYLSLAGRYSVLMPNTARGGGISRKITSPTDRKRLKQVATDLDVPEGMGVILRTAGASRTKAEVKRDFEYLLRLWENVRELTLKSTAPALVYEEGSLIKRSIRDLYNKDIDEILVAGDDAYREAKDFMRMLMPSHAKNVKPYRESQPLFARAGIEAQLDAMFSPQVTLRSGGYIVINQTEALVSIDVNSGRATREHNIEDTALQTNLEASDEISRQLRLRDLAGLIVIDFIDMEEKRNNRSVERKIKDALKNDRARIQVGRISHFGLLEMSRQRIRTGVLESTTTTCQVCQGTGHIRAPASVALHVLRSLEDQLLRGVTHNLAIRTRTSVALYILNQKRPHLTELEQRFGLHITVMADETISNGSHFQIERGEPVDPRPIVSTSVQPDSIAVEAEDEDEEVDVAEIEEESAAGEAHEEADEHEERDEAGGRKRRRRRRRRGEGTARGPAPAEASAPREEKDEGGEESREEGSEGSVSVAAYTGSDDSEEARQRKRRRGRRGGRRGRRGRGGEGREGAVEGEGRESGEPPRSEPLGFGGYDRADPDEVDTTPVVEESRPRRERDATGDERAAPSSEAERADAGDQPYVPAEPTRREESAAGHREKEKEMSPADIPSERREWNGAHATDEMSGRAAPEEEDDADKPKRSGWWQRRSFF
jgi:ribonuclease E